MSWNIAIAVGAALTSLVGVGHMAQEPNFDFGLAVPKTSGNGGLSNGPVSPGAFWAQNPQGPAESSQGGQGGGLGGGQGGGIGGGQGGLGGGIGGGQGGIGGSGFGGGGGVGGFGTIAQDPADMRVVSLNMTNAKYAEVVRRLQQEGANFVIKDSDVRDETVTININNVPLRDALNAIAASMGGYWQRHGLVRVFMKGPDSQNTFGGSWSATPSLNIVTPPAQAFSGARQPAMPGQLIFGRAQQPAMPGQAINGFTLKSPNYFGNPGMSGFNSFGQSVQRQDWKTFMQTLTRAQRQLNKKRGYLKASDLTVLQRALLGIEKPTFELGYGNGKDSIKIKSD